jgi:arabinofuranosyltransferase
MSRTLDRRAAGRVQAAAVPAGIAASAALLAAFAVLAWGRRWTSEDGFIYLRIADNLMHGHGPVFNVGERVEAYTSPAWLAIFAVLQAVVPLNAAWVAVLLGMVCSLLGLGLATAGTLRLVLEGERRGGLLAPFGLLVVVAIPPFWDYATSGLETSLVFLWLGGCWWGLVTAARLRPRRLAVAIGLGVLVRPDMAIFSIAFLVALALAGPLRPRRILALVAWAAAIPVAYQLFRMAYFAALVPATALAKEAGVAFWSRGWAYLANFVDTYALFIPVAVLALWALAGPIRRMVDAGAARTWRTALVGAPVAGAIVHALYIVRLGGDYMHARMLLPTLFGLLLPAFVVRASPRATLALAAVLVPWAVVCATTLRAATRFESKQPFYDQRPTLSVLSNVAPVTLADYARYPHPQSTIGWQLRDLERAGPAVMLRLRGGPVGRGGHTLPWEVPVRVPGLVPSAAAHARVLAYTGSIGRLGYAAGPTVRIADAHGLADPIAARVRLRYPRTAPAGHEKLLPPSWFIARFATGRVPVGMRADVAAARAALRCAPLHRLVQAVTAPLTFHRALSNLRVAFQANGLRFSPDPKTARRELCR